MFIEEVIVDGFKSYATRTVLSGFDKHFNAITGLNGSGKSNILDSICFVLGISNLSQVRVGNLQELVYKQGQAGVTKASVTLVFNNKEKAVSPVGYEHYDQITITRQVVIGGKNKYIINGHTAQASQVQNLFHSVQLNVNNPHFLIMQGRITKVLNMKPPEILGMIEEAAGTRMFETKKQNALKTIEKKQSKVDEINAILKDEITPTLGKLREEKTAYLSWSTNNTEIERLERFSVAYDYQQAEEVVKKGAAEEDSMERERDALDAHCRELEDLIGKKEKEIDVLAKHRDERAAGDYKEALGEEASESKLLVHATTEWNNAKALLESEEKALTDLQAGEKDTLKAVEAKEDQIKKCSEAAGPAEADLEAKVQRHAMLAEEYVNTCAGVSTGKEESLTLTDRIAAAAAEASAADSRIKQGKMKITHLKSVIAQVQKDMKAAEKEVRKLKTEHEESAADVEKLRSKMQSHGYDDKRADLLSHEKEEHLECIGPLKDVIDRLSAQLAGRLAFDYALPFRDFDRAKVKGLVAKLIQVHDPANAVALEVTAGGKLYQVVVEDEQTGKALLQNGKLRRRVTIIPLNKINSGILEERRVDRASSIAARRGGSAKLAIQLVGFAEEVKAAMSYVFGTTIICDCMDTAKEIAFDKGVRARTVTLDGDSFEPQGTLTGGSKADIGSVLGKLQDLTAASSELGRREERLTQITSQLTTITAGAKKWAELNSQLELKIAKLDMLASLLGESSHSQLANKLTESTTALEEAERNIQVAMETKKSASVRHDKLKAEEAFFREKRETMLKTLEADVKAAKAEMTNATAEVKKGQQQLQVLDLELQQLRSDTDGMTKQLKVAAASLEKATTEVERLAELVRMRKTNYAVCQEKVTALKKELGTSDATLKKLRKEKDSIAKQSAEGEIEMKKLVHKLARFTKDREGAKRSLLALMKKYAWIEGEKRYFGIKGTDYDFEARDAAVAQARLRQLMNAQAALGKKINKKVMGMIEKAEAEYQELVHKKNVIEMDKSKIEKVIAELDAKKNAALQTTWVKVTRDFGSIFSTLLPGTSAKLEPPEGSTVLEGLEVKVAFGNVWKESLTELSGGQRSLLALSLILALLLFKPAPMYILDEVDAALDLSHTQNIGTMLKTHFSASQFIVVSLKEGMFNNANVIFRTKFVDGISCISRTVNNSSSMQASKPKQAGSNDASPAKKRGKTVASHEEDTA